VRSGHDVTIEETALPHAFGVVCLCGWREAAFRGLEAAEEMASQHLRDVGLIPFRLYL
jgi:hypothetical protein